MNAHVSPLIMRPPPVRNQIYSSVPFLDSKNFGIWSRIDSIIDERLKKNSKTLSQLIENAFANSTLKKYKPAWIKWLEWSSNYDEISPCPADPLYVALYLNDIFTKDRKVGALTVAVLGIHWGHISSGLHSPTEDPFVKLALEGGQRMLSKNTVKNQKETLSQDIITKSSTRLPHLRTSSKFATSC